MESEREKAREGEGGRVAEEGHTNEQSVQKI